VSLSLPVYIVLLSSCQAPAGAPPDVWLQLKELCEKARVRSDHWYRWVRHFCQGAAAAFWARVCTVVAATAVCQELASVPAPVSKGFV